MTKDEARQRCLTDRMYLGKVLGYDFQDDVHPEMFEALKKPAAIPDDIVRRMILWPRGHFKTSAVVVDIVGNILANPDARILTMQSTMPLTKGWVHEIGSHFSGKNPNSKLLDLFPDFEIASGDAIGFTVKARVRKHLKEPTVAAASPKAVKTGQHYTDGYFDDLVNQLNYNNVELLDKVEKQFNHYMPLIDPGGFITVTGTRYSFADLYNRIITSERKRVMEGLAKKWLVSIRKAYNPDGQLLFKRRTLPDGRAIGVTEEMLATLRREDPETFSAQYLNEILLGSKQIFPEEVILNAVRSTVEPEFPVHSPTYFFIDLAEGKNIDSDHSVISVAKQDNRGAVWLVDCLGDQWSTAQLVSIVLQNVILRRPVRVWIEKQPGATFFAEHLRVMAMQRGINVPIELVPTSNKKDAKYIRISSLETFFKSKKLWLSAGIRDFDRLQEEFVQFPRGRHDDRPDCIASLCNQLAQYYSPQPLTLPVQSPWFVQSILAEENDTIPTANLCGDEFD